MPFLRSVVRTSLTLAALAVAAALVATLWHDYVQAPWTRNGRVSAAVVQIAPEVSGTVAAVQVVDNQRVRSGDILYVIDPQRYRFAVEMAEADAEAKRQDMLMRLATARRRSSLGHGVVSAEDLDKANAVAAIARAAHARAVTNLNAARLDLERATIRSPVDGFVTNFRLRVGDYATAGVTKVAVLDAGSFWITGYFEETKLQRIHAGDVAELRLMGIDALLKGHVESIGRGIADSNDAPGRLGLPTVDPVFSWVRLAQRIPVRIRIDEVPPEVELVAGMTASVAIGTAASPHGAQGRLLSWLRMVL